MVGIGRNNNFLNTSRMDELEITYYQLMGANSWYGHIKGNPRMGAFGSSKEEVKANIIDVYQDCLT